MKEKKVMESNLLKLIALFISMILLALYAGSIQPLVHEKPIQTWSRIWGGLGEDSVHGIAVDGNDIYVVGTDDSKPRSYRYRINYEHKAFLIKYDVYGNQLWNTTWKGLDQGKGYGVAVDDGYVYITGETYLYETGEGGAFIVKYDVDGNQVWNRTWVGTNFNCGRDVSVYDGHIYMTGYTSSFRDAFLAKYDLDGNPIWNTTWGGPAWDQALEVDIDSGNIYIAGFTESFGSGDRDAFLVKYDVNGNQIWNRTWGGTDNDGHGGVAVEEGDIYLVGYATSFELRYSAFLVKYDVDGNQVWNTTWRGPKGTEGYGVAVDRKDIYITGYMGSDIILVKFDADGNQIWNTTWVGPAGDWGYCVAVGNGIYIAGMTNGYGDALLVRYMLKIEIKLGFLKI